MDGVVKLPKDLTGIAANHPGFESGLIIGIYQGIHFTQTENLAVNNSVHSQQLAQLLRRNIFSGGDSGI